MDTDAARRARQKAIKMDLAEVYDDEEASPPEWVDLLDRVGEEKRKIAVVIADETSRFIEERDIRRALAGRDRATKAIRERIVELNRDVNRLNLIAPNSRFTRATLDADEVLRPLFRSERNPKN
jgi:hypothetical protein